MSNTDAIAELNAPTYHVPSNHMPQAKMDAVIRSKPSLASTFTRWDYAFSANEGLRPRLQGEIEKLTADKNEVKGFIGHRERATVQTQRTKADDAQIAAWWKEIATIDAEIQRKQAAKKAAADFDTPLFRVLKAIADTRGALVPADIAVTVPKGSTPSKEFEIRIAAAAEKKEAAKSAFANTSPLLEEIIAKFRRDVRTRESENRPDFRPLFRQRKRAVGDAAPATFGSVIWPIDYLAEAEGKRGRLDPIGLFWWLNADAVADKGEAEIRSRYKPEQAMSSDARNAAIAALNAEALALEYEAGAFAEMAALDGVFVTYPPDMHPLCIAGLREAYVGIVPGS